jgi:hypothetical protein
MEITVRDATSYSARLSYTERTRPTVEDVLGETDLVPDQPAPPRSFNWQGNWGEERTFTLAAT